MNRMSSIHEECGVFAIYSRDTADVAMQTYLGLYALQHRGQESCGIVVNDSGVFSYHKDMRYLTRTLLQVSVRAILLWDTSATPQRVIQTVPTRSPWWCGT